MMKTNLVNLKKLSFDERIPHLAQWVEYDSEFGPSFNQDEFVADIKRLFLDIIEEAKPEVEDYKGFIGIQSRVENALAAYEDNLIKKVKE